MRLKDLYLKQDKAYREAIKEKWFKNRWRVLLFLIIAGLIIIFKSHPVVSWKVILAVAIIWLMCIIILSLLFVILSKGGEGKYLDLWSITHFLSGFILGLLGIPLFWAALPLIMWELVEILGDIQEHRTNAMVDVALAVLAWFVTKATFELNLTFL